MTAQIDESAGGSLARTVVGFRTAIGLATLLMLGLSWPLWTGSADVPRVPFLGGLPEGPRWASVAPFGVLAVTLGLATAGIAWRWMLGLAVVATVALVVGDQQRFQPWVYQFGMAALALATTSASRALGLARLFVVALYVHSGLSKADAAFAHEMGPQLLAGALRPFGLDPWTWPAGVRLGAVMVMPAFELAVGLGLCLARTRRAALAGAVAMHAALIWTLGPWGLGHSTIVLVWNAALIVEDVTLFGWAPSPVVAAGDTWLAPLTRAAFVAAAVLPLGERWGLWDAWPSFALYASHTERTIVLIDPTGVKLPDPIRRALGPADEQEGGFRTLDLTAWSRDVRGVPVYPQNRARNGLAEALAARYPGVAVRVIQWGRADQWTGRRTRDDLFGLDAIRRYGDRYRLNAHPAGTAWSARGAGAPPGQEGLAP
jgi:hypothetical protein